MQLVSIVPIKNIDLMYEDTKIVMLLAHLSKKYPDYVAAAVAHPDVYKIMDNSLIEMGGKAFKIQDLIDEAIKCQADEIILPDVFMNGCATIASVYESIQWLKDNGYLGKFKLMAVAHGQSAEEFVNCFMTLEKIKEVTTIGIPKVYSNRYEMQEMFTVSAKTIHLLGCGKNLDEVKKYKNLCDIRSMDTCIPALNSDTTSDAWKDRPKKYTVDLEHGSVDNVENYRTIVKTVKEYLKDEQRKQDADSNPVADNSSGEGNS